MSEQTKKIPIAVGFIFPNHELLQAAGIGHCKVARRYIADNNADSMFEESSLAEDDFLIEYFGAVKVAMYCGKKYIYIPKNHGWYIEKISKMYISEGYIPICLANNCIYGQTENLFDYSDNYNKTVVKVVLRDGSVVYAYNPNRIGD